MLKFCTLLWDKIDSWLDEGFFFLWLQVILQANPWPNFYQKSYCFAYNSAKNSNFNFFFKSFVRARAVLTYWQKIFDFLISDKFITSYPGHHKDTFFKGSPKNQITTAQISIFFHENFMKFFCNIFSYTKSLNKIIHLVCKKKLQKICVSLPWKTYITP